MSKVYGIGIVGAGVIFQEHARAAQSLRNRFRLIAVADLDQRRLRNVTEQFFCPFAYTDHRRLLDRPDIDIVVIATPPSTHELLVIDALGAGKYVLCEKPLAHTLEAADRIIAVSQRHPNRLTVGYQMRFSEEHEKLLWTRDRSCIGRLQSGSFHRCRPFPQEHQLGASWWGRWQVAGGGVVMTQFIHELDLIIQIFGQPRAVTAALDTTHAPIESEDTFEATIEFENDAVVSCQATTNVEKSKTRFNIVGDGGSVEIPWKLNVLNSTQQRRLSDEIAKAFPSPPRPPSRAFAARAVRKVRRLLGGVTNAATQPKRDMPHAQYYARLIDAIDTGTELPVPAADARRSLELCVGIYAAGITGEKVQFPLATTHRFYTGLSANDYRGRRTRNHANEPRTRLLESTMTQ